MAKTASIVLSDLHINSVVALCKPLFLKDDGGTHKASRTQRALWEAWLDFWETMKEYDCRKVLFLNGDIGEVDSKKRAYPLVSHNRADIKRLVLDVLNPAIEIVDSVVMIRGTPAHTGAGAWLETMVADDLDHAVHSKTSASWWHFRGKIEGVTFDVCHHATAGKLPWTEKNAANKIAKVIVDRYNEKKSPIPKVAIRSHNHKRSDSGRNFPVRAICTPCWSGHTEYAHRMGYENDNPDIGGDVIVCEDGEYEWIDYRYRPLPEGRRVWSIKI